MTGPAALAIEAHGLTKRYGAVDALAGVDLRLEQGQSLALFGPNGAGKTTLLRVLSLALRPSAGTLRLSGLDPRTRDLAIRQRVGMVSHQLSLYDSLSIRENLSFFAALYGVSPSLSAIERLLDRFELTARADDPVFRLSHGLRQRASLARALIHDPPIVFLDEPFTGLDPHATRLLTSTLEELRADGRTLVLVTHNLERGLELSDRWVLLSRGRIRDSGTSVETDPTTFDTRYFAQSTLAERDPIR